MKTMRLYTIILLAVLVITSLAPAPAYAKSSASGSPDDMSLVTELAKTKLARLRVNNRTGGTLYVNFSGTRGYSFSTSQQGRVSFEPVIQPGKYTITVTTSGCKGKLTFSRKVNGGTVSLPGIVCKRKK